MPLPKPSLDNRSFDQLVSECRSVLAREAPQWTDHNASDPGITLLELGAWLGEQNIFRFDQLTDEARRAFIRLVGVELQPAAPARTVVALGSPDGVAIDLPARMQLAGGGEPLFETTEGLFVSPARLQRVGHASRAGETGETRRWAVDMTRGPAAPFAAFGSRPRPGDALLLGFDRALDAPGARLSLYVHTDHWHDDEATRHALQAEAAARQARCGPAAGQPLDWRQHYRVRTVWEYYTTAGVWAALADVEDETRALSLSGFVRFAAPTHHGPSGHYGPSAPYLVRCRIAHGRFECPPQIVHLAFNAVACEHALSRTHKSIGVSRGHAGAVFAIGEAPVVAGSTALSLHDNGGHTQDGWQAVSDWDRSGAHDLAYRLDAQSGEIESGDGLRGAILPAGYELLLRWQRGGGAEGNIGRGTLTQVPLHADNLVRAPALAGLLTPLQVNQPFDAQGGAAAETVEQAQARAFDRASEVDKAVTLEDFERLALATPGVPVARVRAVANMDPLLPCYAAPGAVTLVVIPPCPRKAPLPSRALLDAVLRHLAPRRLVTSEIHATAPRYRKLAVSATLHLGCGTNAALVVRAARARLDAYLDPLTGGLDGGGWPFGGGVYRSEVLALLAGTPGVKRVTALGFLVGAASRQQPRCDNVLLCPDELVRAGQHRLATASEVASSLQRSEPHECESR